MKPRKSASPQAAAKPQPALPTFLRQVGEGRYRLDLAVVPNARRTEAVGVHDQALRVRLAAPPVDGAANTALLRWVAQSLGVPQREVELLHGAASRRKQLGLHADAAAVQAWLVQLRPVLDAPVDLSG